MAVTFPASPTDGQQVTANSKTYTFSSASGTWNITGSDNPIDILFTRSEFVATANQTTFSVTYNTDYPIEVFVNGLQYLASDYTATNGTSVVFNTGLPADAEVVIMYATSGLDTIPNSLTDLSITDGTNGQVLTTDGSGNFTFEDAAGGGVTVYATIADLPLSGNDVGAQAFVEENDRLYLWTGSGWYNIALINTAPNITGAGAGSYFLATDGTPTVITLTAEDPEGLSITWSYAVTSGSLGSAATVSQADNVFTITPSTDTANAGTFELTFTASDGVNIATDVNSFTLIFVSAFWDETTLSIGTSSTNSLDNSTFIDRSTNAHTVTPTGTPVQTVFNPYLDNWSAEFDGSGDYLTISDSSLVMGTGDFTYECWVYSSSASDDSIIETRASGASSDTTGFTLTFLNSSVIRVWFNGASRISSSGSYYNRWVHVAVVKSSGTTTLYIDGVSIDTTTTLSNLTNNDIIIGQGRYTGGTSIGSGDFPGYIANLRVVKGTALYTANFTPSTENLTAVSGTSLLTCQSNRFIDNSTSAHALTVSGNVKVSAFNPFGQGSEYSVTSNKGATLFDGSGDYVSASTSSTFAVGSGDWTIECWAYSVNNRATYGPGTLCDLRTAPVAESFAWRIQNNLALRFANTAANTTFDTTTNVFKMGAWNHLAVVRDGSTLYQYVNGVQVGSTSTGYNWGTSGWPIRIGGNLTSGYEMDGHISDFRLVKGSAVYPNGTTFTPPTSPIGNTNASIYLPMDNAGIFDKTGNHTLTPVGNASTSTTQTKFADTAMYFDGTGDYLSGIMNRNIAFGTEDMTIECWVYANSLSGQRTIFDTRQGGASFGSDSFVFSINSGIPVTAAGSYSLTTTIVQAPSTINLSTWVHIAVTRENGTNRLFIDGISVDSNTKSWNQTFTNGRAYYIGQTVGFDRPFNGYIENLQILKGVAKYTANFTPPTQEQGRTYQAES